MLDSFGFFTTCLPDSPPPSGGSGGNTCHGHGPFDPPFPINVAFTNTFGNNGLPTDHTLICNTSQLSTGLGVTFTGLTGTGLPPGTVVYVRVIDANTVSLYYDAASAIAGNPDELVWLLNNGETGTLTVAV